MQLQTCFVKVWYAVSQFSKDKTDENWKLYWDAVEAKICSGCWSVCAWIRSDLEQHEKMGI